LHRLWMQRLSENMSRVVHSAFVTGRAIVTFRVHIGPDLLWSGADLHPANIIRHVEGENAFQRSRGPTFWGAMSLPVADMVSLGAALIGLDLRRRKIPRSLTLHRSQSRSSSGCMRQRDGWRKTRLIFSLIRRRRAVSNRR